jgi:hypothetical protein
MKTIIIVIGVILVLYSSLIMSIGKRKAWCHIRWFLAVIPFGILQLSAYIVYPIAYLFEKANIRVLTWWLDDHIYDFNKNEDWRVWIANNGGVANFFTMYKWHANRNRMMNLNYKIKPKSGRVHCIENNEKFIDVIFDDLKRNGNKVNIYGKCLEVAELKWIDKNGNEGWQVNQGIKISKQYTTWGKCAYYYEVFGVLYYRFSYCFPKIVFGKKYVIQIKYGTDHKGYFKTLKINKYII